MKSNFLGNWSIAKEGTKIKYEGDRDVTIAYEVNDDIWFLSDAKPSEESYIMVKIKVVGTEKERETKEFTKIAAISVKSKTNDKCLNETEFTEACFTGGTNMANETWDLELDAFKGIEGLYIHTTMFVVSKKSMQIYLALIFDTFSCLDPCSPNPCENGGTCSPEGKNFTCTCQIGWMQLEGGFCTYRSNSKKTIKKLG